MRYAWVVVGLAACYQPQNNPYPYPDAGIARPDSWTTSPDAAWHPDAPPHPDAAAPDAPPDAARPPPVCGDGVREPGEVCFGAPQTIDPGGLVYSARLRDLDGDGKLDLVYLTRTNVVIQRGDGHGHFAAATAGPATDSWWLDVGDIDGDGIADLAATGRQQLTIWFGTGGGAFGPAHAIALYDAPIGLAVAEVDGHPGNEILVATASYLYTYTWFVNDFDQLSLTGITGEALAVGDLDADGLADSVVTAYDEVYRFQGTVDGMRANGYVGDSATFAGVALANVDSDPHLDAIAAAPEAQQLSIYSRVDKSSDSATTHLQASEVWPVTTGTPRFVAAADLDGDGIAEVMAGMPDTMQLQLFHPGGAAAAPIQLAEPMTSQVFDGDANGDGVADLVVTLQDKIIVLPSAAP